MIIDSPIISGSSAASGSLNQFGNVSITGSLFVNGVVVTGNTGSAESASYAGAYTLTSSFQSYTASTDARIASINTSTASLNSYTASTDAKITSINAFSASILNYTSSTDAKLTALYAFSSSLLSYTSSTDAKIASIYTTTASLNASVEGLNVQSASLLSYTASTDAKITSIYSTTASLNAAVSSLNSATSSLNTTTASLNASVTALNAQTASLLSYTSSTDAKITSIYTTTSSLNASVASLNNYTSSNTMNVVTLFAASASLNASVAGLNAQTASLLSYTSSNDATNTSQNTRLSALEAATASIYTATASLNASVASLNTQTASLLSYTSSNSANVATLFAASASLNASVAGLNSYTSSLNAKTASFATTGSNTLTGVQYVSNNSQATSFTSTASIYTDGGMRVTRDAYVSGTLYLNNLTVFGTQSVNFITSSQLNIATNIITVNTSTPTVRFGGLAVQDSGSGATGLTGSILWDSQDNQWIYSNPSGSTYDSAVFLVGPRSTGALGSEVGITTNALAKGDGMHHMTSSGIFEVSGNVGIGTSSPGYKLDVVGDVFINGSYSLKSSTNGNIFLKSVTSEANSWIYQEASTDWGMFVVNNNTQLNALGGIFAGSGLATFIATSNNAGISLSSTTGGGSSYGVIAFEHSLGHAYFAGSVGIGTISPSQKLTVSGSARFNSSQPDVQLNISDSTQYARLYFLETGSGISGVQQIGSTFSTTARRNRLEIFGNSISFINGNFVDVAMLITGSNVGIGTTSPSQKLHVVGKIYSIASGTDGGEIRLANSGGGSNWYLAARTTGLNFAELDSADGRIFIANGGNVGIGTTNPNAKLHVLGTVEANGSLYRAVFGSAVQDADMTGLSGGNGSEVQIQAPAINRGAYLTLGGGMDFGEAMGGVAFYNSNNVDGKRLRAFMVGGQEGATAGEQGSYLNFGTVANAGTVPSERMRITSTGNVGIGTTSPSRKLDVNGTSVFRDFTSVFAGGGNVVSNITWLSTDSGIMNIYTGGNSTVQLNSSGVSYFNGGNVGIGTTAPSLLLHIYKAGDYQLRLQNPNTGGGYWNIGQSDNGFNAGGNKLLFVPNSSDSSTATVVFTTGGSVGIGTTSPVSLFQVSGTSTLGSSASNGDVTVISNSTPFLIKGRSSYDRGFMVLSWDVSPDCGVIITNSLKINVNATPGSNTGTVAMTITSGGNVGIGTTSPLTKLHVVGSISAEYSDSIYLDYSPSAGSYKKGFSGLNQSSGVARGLHIFNYDNDSSQGINFWVGTNASKVQAATISSGGKVQINSPSDTGPRLSVLGTANDWTVGAMGSSTTGQSYGILITAGTNSSDYGFYVQNQAQTSVNFVIRGDNNVGIGTTNPDNSKLRIRADHQSGYSILSIQPISNQTATLGFYNSSAARKGMVYTTDTSLAIETDGLPIDLSASGNTRVRVTTDGNVGIGTTSPSVRLQVVGANSAEGQLYVGNTDVTYSAGINFTTSGTNRGFVGWRHTNSGAPFSLTGIHLFNTDNSNIVFGTNNVVQAVINVSGNVGIGTTGPIDKLHIVGGLTSTGLSNPSNTSIGSLQIGYDGTKGVIRTWNSSPLITSTYNYQAFETSGTERMRILSSGNVGIEITSPVAKLDITGTVDTVDFSSLALRAGNSDDTSPESNQILFGYANSVDYAHAIKTRHQSGSPAGNAFDFYTWKHGDAAATRARQYVMTIQANGVGIGTMNPTVKLDIRGGNFLLKGDATDGGILTITRRYSTGQQTINFNNNHPTTNLDWTGARIVSADAGSYNGYLDFQVSLGSNANEAAGTAAVATVMRLTKDAYVGIGTTSPEARLHVSGQTYMNNGTSNALYIRTTVADTTTRDAIYLYEDSGQASGRQAISWYNGNSGGGSYYKARLWTQVGSSYVNTQFGIDVANNAQTLATRLYILNGDTYHSGDVIAYASDLRLKENIKPIENALEKVQKISGVHYQWKDEVKELGFEPTNKQDIGVIAQAIQAVLPEAVKPAPFDYDGGVSKSGENYLTVQYEKIVPLLIEAIKEQQQQIDELKYLLQTINK